MITLNREKNNSILENCIKYNLKLKEKLIKDINSIHELCSILHDITINVLDKPTGTSNDLLLIYSILAYEQIKIINDYTDYECPLCKKKECLSFHKTYERNIILHLFKYEICAKIDIIVLKCENCCKSSDEHGKQVQKYHALLPDFIFPYKIYSAYTIIKALYDKHIRNLKISTILNKYRIAHQLLYDWINKFKRYLITSSVILSTNVTESDVIKSIMEDPPDFVDKFYKKYHHPYFLFKRTCVTLAINP